MEAEAALDAAAAAIMQPEAISQAGDMADRGEYLGKAMGLRQGYVGLCTDMGLCASRFFFRKICL